MSDERNDDHWNDLAKQLGLPIDEARPGPKQEARRPEPAAARVAVPRPAVVLPKPAMFEEDDVAPEEAFLQAPLDHVAPIDTSGSDVGFQAQADDQPIDGPADPLAHLAELEETESGDKPKRRRRGRGRGRKKDDIAGEGAVAEKTGDEEPRARRGRGRKKATEEVESAETTAVAEEEDNEEVEDVSEWNIPAWNDLIASLYRPDR